MARHRKRRSYKGYGRRHRRHHRGGGYGLMLSPARLLRESVSVKDAAIGGFVGLGGALGALYAFNKLNATRQAAGQSAIGFTTVPGTNTPTPAFWVPFIPAIGGIAVGAAGYMAMKRNRRRGAAILAGSILGGLIVTGLNYAKNKWSGQFGDYLKVRLNGYGNVLVQQGALGNMLVTTPIMQAAGPGQFRSSLQPVRRASMGQLSLAAMSPAARATNGYLRIANRG